MIKALSQQNQEYEAHFKNFQTLKDQLNQTRTIKPEELQNPYGTQTPKISSVNATPEQPR